MNPSPDIHLSEAALIHLVRAGHMHPHIGECAFCREQFEDLVQLLSGDYPTAEEPQDREKTAFRLAAQTEVEEVQGQRWRQTWYLEEGAVLVRVVEDVRERMLLGFCICDVARYGQLRLRFSGLDETFVPDRNGRFVLGPASLEVEPMSVTIESPT